MYDLNRRANQGAARVTDLNANGLIDGADLLRAWSDGIDTDGNGYVDDIIGWDFVNNDNDPMDDSGHGTHGAGVIIQVAPRAEVLPLKFLDSNAVGSLSAARQALDYALAKQVPLSANGWTASVFSEDWLAGLRKAEGLGHLFVTAAGNGDPALLQILNRLHLSNVAVVTSIDAIGRLASFSNWDPDIVDLAAPGVRLSSAMPGGQYAVRSGTSVSTALAAGIAALVRGNLSRPNRTDWLDYETALSAILNWPSPIPPSGVAVGGDVPADHANHNTGRFVDRRGLKTGKSEPYTKQRSTRDLTSSVPARVGRHHRPKTNHHPASLEAPGGGLTAAAVDRLLENMPRLWRTPGDKSVDDGSLSR
jgi:subtilisin family serine protease